TGTVAAPPNFSWVEHQKLAGLACPSETQHYKFLVENGISHLVYSCPELILHHISIVDFSPLSLPQILRFLRIKETANAKGEHVMIYYYTLQTERSYTLTERNVNRSKKSVCFCFVIRVRHKRDSFTWWA
uniref:Uncharacterized protein n=1 Tax=Cyprinus carpio TaxID=7962 RepID=A0A8C1YY50_CYPCA